MPVIIIAVTTDFSDDVPGKIGLIWLRISLEKIHGIFFLFGGKVYWVHHLLLSGLVFLHHDIIEFFLSLEV